MEENTSIDDIFLSMWKANCTICIKHGRFDILQDLNKLSGIFNITCTIFCDPWWKITVWQPSPLTSITIIISPCVLIYKHIIVRYISLSILPIRSEFPFGHITMILVAFLLCFVAFGKGKFTSPINSRVRIFDNSNKTKNEFRNLWVFYFTCFTAILHQIKCLGWHAVSTYFIKSFKQLIFIIFEQKDWKS